MKFIGLSLNESSHMKNLNDGFERLEQINPVKNQHNNSCINFIASTTPKMDSQKVTEFSYEYI